MTELEERLAVEELTNEEVELVQEKAHYDVKRSQVACQCQLTEEDRDEGEDEGEDGQDEEQDEDELVCSFGLLVKGKGKHPAK